MTILEIAGLSVAMCAANVAILAKLREVLASR